MFKNMKDEIMDFVNYIENILINRKESAQKIFLNMKKNDESPYQGEI